MAQKVRSCNMHPCFGFMAHERFMLICQEGELLKPEAQHDSQATNYASLSQNGSYKNNCMVEYVAGKKHWPHIC